MASYGVLVRKITTAEINRVQREGGYDRWSYFVDERSGKVGVIFANDTTFSAYTVDDSSDPKLLQFGLEPIAGLLLTPSPDYLVLKAGPNEFRALVFSDPLVLIDDDFTDAFNNADIQAWQDFLYRHGVQVVQTASGSILPKLVLAGIGVLIAILLAVALLG
jgi:hypothetical protein